MLLPDFGCVGHIDRLWDSSYLRDTASRHRSRSERSDICLGRLYRGGPVVEV